MSTSPSPISGRIEDLRQRLAEQNLSGFLQPRADRHQGEMVPACDERLAWISGFTGSAGLALILADKAALFVDGRYELQAEAETDPALFEPVSIKKLDEWTQGAAGDGVRIGYDPWLMTREAAEQWKKRLAKTGAQLIALPENPIDAIWTDRPPPPEPPARAHPETLAGVSSEDKRGEIAKALAEEKIDLAVLTLPDAVAWLLNIRGADIPNTPVTLAFALIDQQGAVTLFTEPGKFDATLRATLGNTTTIEPWSAFEAALSAQKGRRVLVDKASAPMAVSSLLEAAEAKIVWGRDPTSLPKARKNKAEIEGARAAHLRDGAALVETLRWIETRVREGGLTELEVAEELTRRRQSMARRQGSECVDESFSPIVGYGPNGAIVHYRVTPETSAAIKPGSLLLLDSGGQYPDGTTDVTRTIAIGAPSAEMRAIFTRVLKGMIAISRLSFPEGTTGRDIDAFARAALWEVGLDFDHGVGHGVGSFLSVHEGPQRISRVSGVPLETGMILSNEPGCYLTGAFGIRIENLILVTEAETPEPIGPVTPERKMRRFETLTWAPIDRELIDTALLRPEERDWLDAYHREVAQRLLPLLDEETAHWLRSRCAAL